MTASRDEDTAVSTGTYHRGWQFFVTSKGVWLARKDNEWVSSGSESDLIALVNGIERSSVIRLYE